MTYKQLKARYNGSTFTGYGHFRISFTIRGKEYTCTTTNTLAIDRVNDDDDNRQYGKFYETKKQALQALYNEVKQATEGNLFIVN